MARSIFTHEEKMCLQELIVKYKLNRQETKTAGNPGTKKIAWARLTDEFNCIETNSKRTEAQLKKLFDNLKTRRKAELTVQKKDRMRTGGGKSQRSPEPSTSTAQDSMLVDEHVLNELTDVEIQYSIDSDSVFVTQEEGDPVVYYDVQGVPQSEGVHEDVAKESDQLNSTAQPSKGRRRSGDRRASSRLSDSDRASHGLGGKNIRARIIQEEFLLRKESFKRTEERELELHSLKLEERQWLAKAAEEIYKKAVLEREAAQLVLNNLKK